MKIFKILLLSFCLFPAAFAQEANNCTGNCQKTHYVEAFSPISPSDINSPMDATSLFSPYDRLIFFRAVCSAAAFGGGDAYRFDPNINLTAIRRIRLFFSELLKKNGIADEKWREVYDLRVLTKSPWHKTFIHFLNSYHTEKNAKLKKLFQCETRFYSEEYGHLPWYGVLIDGAGLFLTDKDDSVFLKYENGEDIVKLDIKPFYVKYLGRSIEVDEFFKESVKRKYYDSEENQVSMKSEKDILII